jgi:hypothetical protein
LYLYEEHYCVQCNVNPILAELVLKFEPFL